MDQPPADLEYDEGRVFSGAKYGGLTIAILFGAWRLAVTIDTAKSAVDWFWLPFEWVILQFTFFLLVIPLAMIGSWLFDHGHHRRWQSVLGTVLLAMTYGWMLFVFDLLGMDEHAAFGIPFANFLVLLISGALGGIYAHRVWFAVDTDAA